jgi:tRNA uridine 5-carboxymethylaminomethyl modification enzyme
VSCWITHTPERTHEIIRGALDRSPLYTGRSRASARATAPRSRTRWCASPRRRSHQIFVEPEGLDTHEFYPNGISTSLPFDVQLALVRSNPRLERAHVTRPATRSNTTISIRAASRRRSNQGRRGLYLRRPDQRHHGLRGSRGAGPGRGLNARAATRGEAPGPRAATKAYVGVLIDDLVTNGTIEPYRMFTRAREYRCTCATVTSRRTAAHSPRGRAAAAMGCVDDACAALSPRVPAQARRGRAVRERTPKRHT